MIIEKLEMLNWGPYRGHQTLEFATPNGERVIEHVRAMNGHGKTNILEALKIGLHGAAAMKFIGDDRNVQSARQNLHEYLLRKVTIGANTGGGPHVELVLTLAETTDGDTRKISIKRQWWLDDPAKIDEQLTILVNGEPFAAGDDEIPAENYIAEIIPAEVVQFFFFDGERIQTLADSELASGSGTPIANALDDLLGFTTLESLKQDLTKLRQALNTSATQNKSAAAKAASIEATIAGIQSEISAKRDAIYAEHAKRDEILRAVENIKRQLPAGDGGSDPASEGVLRLTERIAEADDRRTKAERVVTDAIGQDLSLAVANALAERTLSQIDAERRLREWNARTMLSHPEADAIAEAMFGPDAPQPDPPITEPQATFFSERLKAVWNKVAVPTPEGLPTEQFFNAFSNDQLARAQVLLANRRKDSLNSVGPQLTEVDHIQQQLQFFKDQINQVGDAQERRRLRDELDQAIEASGKAAGRCEQLERELYDLEEDLAAQERLLREAHTNSTGDLLLDHQLQVTHNLVSVVEEFRESMRRTRVADLAENMQGMLITLAHKGDEQFAKCVIDERSYVLTILDKHGERLENPSAGEKELIALSMIWSLGIISRRRLPLVIDTPLGRLDPEHRLAVIEKFLPHAAEQVIVLSQESEITNEYRKLLAKYIASEQQVVWQDRVNGSTIMQLPPLGAAV